MENNCQFLIPICAYSHTQCDCVNNRSLCKYQDKVCLKEETDKIPTFKQIFDIYSELVKDRFNKTGQLGSKLKDPVGSKVRQFMREAKISEDDKVNILSYSFLENFASDQITKGVKKVSLITKLSSLSQIFSRWAIKKYNQMGFEVNSLVLPEIKSDFQRYRSISEEKYTDVEEWYRSLLFKKTLKERIFVMFMFKYAMRNGDVLKLKYSNIKENKGSHFLEYTPHKTALTSKRVVTIKMDEMDYRDLMKFKDSNLEKDLIFGNPERKWGMSDISMVNRLNKDFRKLGFNGSKGLYELRKICIDRAYRKHGKEYAEAISGDRYDTLCMHYADPSSVSSREDD